ncbi:MAG: DegT/DnrJ/EryC1/StrS family aminotransferase [Candidatus Melainabacteria bacterium]|nr:DegT/DnrJ/EryC1/StrS family aminotransferase [Candidatus Melainabacteria bacterium]
MSNNIPIFSAKEQYPQIAADLEAAVLEVMRSGNYIMGQKNKTLEQQIARICGAKHGIGVANGTDALILALWALDIGPGDEVITTPFTFAATIEAIALRGARPVFVDVDEKTFNIDCKAIERVITPKAKAIIPVHLYGQACDMDPIMELADRYALKVVEDNAQAISASYKGKPTGSFGDAACISFYPTKNLGACGDAGMIVTSNDELAERLRCLRAHGSKQRYFHEELGVNSRLDEIQAAVLLTKLRHLEDWTDKRRAIAGKYFEALKSVPGIILPNPAVKSEYKHVWHQYTVRVLETNFGTTGATMRQQVIDGLAKRGIGSMCYYPVPLHMQEAYRHYGYKQGDFPVTERLASEVLSLPMFPELKDQEIQAIGQAFAEIMTEQVAVAPIAVPTPPVAL